MGMSGRSPRAGDVATTTVQGGGQCSTWAGMVPPSVSLCDRWRHFGPRRSPRLPKTNNLLGGIIFAYWIEEGGKSRIAIVPCSRASPTKTDAICCISHYAVLIGGMLWSRYFASGLWAPARADDTCMGSRGEREPTWGNRDQTTISAQRGTSGLDRDSTAWIRGGNAAMRHAGTHWVRFWRPTRGLRLQPGFGCQMPCSRKTPNEIAQSNPS